MFSLMKSRLSGKALFFIFIACFLSSFLYATIINVPDDYTTIQLGIDAATIGDTVLIAEGTYVENINYNGKLITVASLFLTTQDTTNISSTIIDGNSSDCVVTFINGEDSTAVLCGFTITNGLGDGTHPDYYGGGITCKNLSSPSLENLIITGNSVTGTQGYGGGICCRSSSSPSLLNVTITDNSADFHGGGIYCRESSPSLQNVTITGNSADFHGGGIYCCESSPSLQNVTITGNSANISGGGIYCLENSSLSFDSVNRCNIFLNFAGSGCDLDTYNCNTIDVIVDTFTVLQPDDYFAYPIDNFTFDILNAKIEQVNQDLYVSPDGSNDNSGLTVADPLLAISYALSIITADSLETHTIHLSNGIYSPSQTGEIFPLNCRSYISLLGEDEASTILDGEGLSGILFCRNDNNFSIENMTIQNGSAHDGGGILCWENSNPILQNVTISGNYANSGGGIECSQSSPSLENVTISGNSAAWGGGIVCSQSSSCLINVIITNNSAINGGGISCYYNSSPSLQNVTITNNSASQFGGGICCNSSSPILQNVTITGNSATLDGGGIHCYNNSSPSLINCVLWNDSPEEIYIASGSVTATYSDIQGGFTGIGNIDADPLFVNPSIGDYQLQSISPCINTGDPDPQYNDPDGTRNDMGAYFFNQAPITDFAANTTNGEVPLTVNFTDLSTLGFNLGVIDEWYWDFGDGNNSSLQNPANEYLLPGIYTVSLTVTDVNDFTDTETKVNYITINPPDYSGPVWHISTTGSDLWGNGSIQYPFATIQHGINISADTNTILAQPGTYVENINYNGKLITVGSLFLTTTDTTYISSTIIDGNSSGNVVTFENSEDSTAVLCGFTVTNGLAGSFPDAGGGICCLYSSPSLQNLIITGNSSIQWGGGIYCGYYSSPILQNVTITGNTASGASSFGGGIYCYYNSSPSLQNVTISGNSAVYSGGGIICNSSSPNLMNVTISDNSTYVGGGIYCYNSSPSLENVTISGNSASLHGGGIWCCDSNPSLENVTISGNSADYYGGGIYCSDSNPVLINSILWNDSPEEIFISSGSVTATYSDIQGGFTGTGNIDSDPLFVDPLNSDYHLTATSPCIDAGDPDPQYNDPDGTINDMGAYYSHQTIPPDPPQNVTVEIIGSEVHLSWDAVTGANSYKVYSSDDPLTGFTEDSSGSFAGESWSAPIGDIQKFYYVIASTEIIRSKNSYSHDAYRPDRRSRRHYSDK